MKKVKEFLNKDVTDFLKRHKIALISIVAIVLLACVGLIATYAFYQSVDTTPVIGGSTGKIADLEVRVMAEERDTNGNGLGSYAIYPYIPKAGYKYNETKSHCTNGATISYDATNYNADITATGHDVCYLYFDSTANLDLTLYVYAENVNSDGEGTGEYTKLETTALPSVGYEFNASRSSCENGSSISYSASDNMFTIEATQKDVCVAYMDALDVDIALKVYVQAKAGSSLYYEAESIPTNNYYSLNSSKSACTGTTTLSIANQKVTISATGKTNCVAYLDIASGPIEESLTFTGGVLTSTTDNSILNNYTAVALALSNATLAVDTGSSYTLTVSDSAIGTKPVGYYFSSDGGETYVSSETNSYTFTNLSNIENRVFKAYSVDKDGNESAVLSVTASNTYVYNGAFEYTGDVQSKVIEQSGYYRLQVWGAEGGTYNSKYAIGGAGGYSTGLVYLNAGDTIYIYTGGAGVALDSGASGGFNGGGNANYRGGGGGGATDIRINSDSLFARVIVAGGGGGANATSSKYHADGGAGGGTMGVNGNTYSSNAQAYAGKSASYLAGGAGGTGDYNGLPGDFGLGGNTESAGSKVYSSGAGGGGFFGGGAAANSEKSENAAGGAGGSGYVYTESTSLNYPSGCLLNSNYYLKDAYTYNGLSSFISPNEISETGHTGSGYAKITYIGSELHDL